jgi:uncharacterized protein YjiS (DUF1127 family)
MSNSTVQTPQLETHMPVFDRPISRSIRDWAATEYAAWRVRRADRQDAARLEFMGDRMLRDIGLRRSEVGHVIRLDP